MSRTILFLFLNLLSFFAYAQNDPKVMPLDTPAVVKQVDSLIQVTRNLFAKNDFYKALEINTEAEKIALEKLGRESASYGKCCNSRARILSGKGDYAAAEHWAIESRNILERTLGKMHPEYALSTNHLGLHYRATGDYEKAEALLLEAMNIREKVLGKTHREYAQSLNNLATLYKDMGNYELAEPLYLESKALREKTSESDALGYARSLNNLAVLYLLMGDYEKAEPLFLQTKDIRARSLGTGHSDYANAVGNLSLLYLRMGRFEKAEYLLLETQGILEKTVGRSSPNFAENLANLASLYSEMNDDGKIEPLLLEAQAIWEKSLGRESPPSAANLSRLGRLYYDLGNYEKAERLMLEAKMLKEKSLGKQHPDYARSLGNLGVLYDKMGEIEKARQYCLEALTILEASFGKMNPDYIQFLQELAFLYHKQGEFATSDAMSSEMTALQHARLSRATTYLSEQELAEYTSIFQQGGLFINNCLFARPKNQTGQLPVLAFDNALFQKGFLRTAAVQQNIRAAATPESATINQQLKGYRRRLATAYTKPIAERKNVAVLENAINTAEKELARTVKGYAENTRLIKWQEVQSALKKDEAAIEFIHFKVNFLEKTDSTMYAALLLFAGNAQPIFVPLFEEKQLEALLKTSGARKSDYVNRIYTTQKGGAKSLYELVWKPLESSLTGVKTVYCSPSGLLHRINLSAVSITEKENLGDHFRFVELGSTRQLVIPSVNTLPGNNEAHLWGGIQYDMDSTAIRAAIAGTKNEQLLARGNPGLPQMDSFSRGGSWGYLPWTEKEISAIAPILTAAGAKPKMRKGFVATEEAFISTNGSNESGPVGPTKSPRILHIATHGYFFPDPKTGDQGRGTMGEEPAFKMSDHPMIRSGLLLAGANHAWKSGKSLRPDMEDGVLTAYEISQMDLSNTELVVLSACETGLGDIQGNEGVYGLQRAFKIAGAKYLIMSLWQVPDFQTQELMVTFYNNWLTLKQPIPDAFRAAQQTIREKYGHPYFWAGFVVVE